MIIINLHRELKEQLPSKGFQLITHNKLQKTQKNMNLLSKYLPANLLMNSPLWSILSGDNFVFFSVN